MKKAERILIFLLIASTVLAFSRMPLGKAFFTIVSLVLSVVYLLGSVILFNNIKFKQALVKSAYAGIGVKEIVMSILAGLSLSYFACGLLFLVNDWSINAAKMVVYSAILFAIPVIGLSVIFLIANHHLTYRRILWRLLSAIILLGVVVVLTIWRSKNWI